MNFVCIIKNLLFVCLISTFNILNAQENSNGFFKKNSDYIPIV